MYWSIDEIKYWNENIGHTINTIGTMELPFVLSKAIQCLIPNISIVIFVSPNKQQPHLAYDNYPKRIHSINTIEWLAGPYLFDPFYIKCFDGSPPGLYHLSDAAPDEFLASEYYHQYYYRTRCTDEACFISHVNKELRVSLSVSRIEKNEAFIKTEIDKLRTISPIVINILKTHFQQIEHKSDNNLTLLHSLLTTGLTAFGSSILTAREHDMIQLILKGHSSKSIAKFLFISIDTVKMHRKNAYSKLNISTQAELFSLVISSLACVENLPSKNFL